MIALLRPLVRGSTYRRAVFLMLGAVILLPYVLLVTVLARMLVAESANRAAVLLIAAVAAAIAAVPPFLGGTRELEIAAARALLQVELPEGHGPLARETRLRSALWFGVHLAVGAVIGTALLVAVPMALVVLTERLGLTSGALAGLALGPLGADDLWAWTVVGVLLLIGTAYAVAGLGALAATMAPVLLGPSPAERLAALEARGRRLAERNRLARELHDSVGHALTATTLQAGAARQVFDRDPDFARRALEAIEETGRAAMEDLDRVLGVLRADDDRLPHRTLDDLDRLIADIRRGGLDLSTDVTVRPLPAGLSQESYRIVQEGLTNAAKYGAGSAALTLTVGPEVTIEITNALPVQLDESRTPGSRTGNGLAGMRERVRLIGGTLEAGPRNGIWRVAARIPVADR
jgi:signal transduction histidine kinase